VLLAVLLLVSPRVVLLYSVVLFLCRLVVGTAVRVVEVGVFQLAVLRSVLHSVVLVLVVFQYTNTNTNKKQS
jgi:hypothetical protein